MKQQWHSGFDDSSGWGRLIDPVCLFILCQIAGTLWVITPRKAFAPPVAPNASVDVHRAEVAELVSQKSSLEKAVKLARQEAATVAKPAEANVTEADRLAAQIRLEEQRIRQMEETLAELTRREADVGNKIAGVSPPNPELGREAERLSQQLAEKQSEVKRLQSLLEQTKGPGGGSGVGSPRLLETGLRPRVIQLIGDMAVPVDGEHYEIRTGFLQDRTTRAIQYTKKDRGESPEELVLSNSKVSAYIQKMDPTKEYLLCLVNSDSFRVFREVRKLARSKGVQVGWDTNYRTDGVIIFGLGGGGKSNLPGPTEGN